MTEYLKRDGLPDLAYIHTQGQNTDLPLVMFLPGFRSDMGGTKAVFLEDRAKQREQAFLRFDYSGHGISGGDFEDGTISQWAQDALSVLDHVSKGQKSVLVGSSMGGWIGLIMALARPDSVTGYVGIAAAPDFTDDMYNNRMNEEQRTLLNEQGHIDVPNEYSDEPYRISKALIDDGQSNRLLSNGIDMNMPVRLVQGMQDADVEWQHSHRIKNAMTGDDVEVLLIKDGDHRLSRPQDLEIIDDSVKAVSGIT
ncbi:MAG: alpha/beta hydrolase [Pseudomonadota bacterium]